MASSDEEWWRLGRLPQLHKVQIMSDMWMGVSASAPTISPTKLDMGEKELGEKLRERL